MALKCKISPLGNQWAEQLRDLDIYPPMADLGPGDQPRTRPVVMRRCRNCSRRIKRPTDANTRRFPPQYIEQGICRECREQARIPRHLRNEDWSGDPRHFPTSDSPSAEALEYIRRHETEWKESLLPSEEEADLLLIMGIYEQTGWVVEITYDEEGRQLRKFIHLDQVKAEKLRRKAETETAFAA